MTYRSRRPRLILTSHEREELRVVSSSPAESTRRSERARILLAFADGVNVSAIARRLATNRPRIARCLDRAQEDGPLAALDDRPRSGRPPRITREARAWIVATACHQPRESGHPALVWTLELLVEHLRAHCRHAGHPCLEKIARGTVWKILDQAKASPHTRYCLEKRGLEVQETEGQVRPTVSDAWPRGRFLPAVTDTSLPAHAGSLT